MNAIFRGLPLFVEHPLNAGSFEVGSLVDVPTILDEMLAYPEVFVCFWVRKSCVRAQQEGSFKICHVYVFVFVFQVLLLNRHSSITRGELKHRIARSK